MTDDGANAAGDVEQVLDCLHQVIGRADGRYRALDEGSLVHGLVRERKAVSPGRCSVPTLYSLCQRISPAPASRRACSRLSAMCQESSTRQLARLTTVPAFLAASSANSHCCGSATSGPASTSSPAK